MKKILLFGAGKSASTLIHHLAEYCEDHGHQFTVCDRDLELVESKLKDYKNSQAALLNVTNETERQGAITKADLVISLLPPSLHILVARDCLKFYKTLLTASYIDDQLMDLADEIKRREILFISEMGLDPGIDHMSAMHIINRLRAENAKIHSFYSHCGGLVAPESDNNPWHYKITWNPRNVVTAGSAGAKYLVNGVKNQIGYKDVFSFDNQTLDLPETGTLAWYANRDSLSYLHTYGLEGLDTFIRTTLRYPSYNKAWNLVVQLDLTNSNDKEFVSGCHTVYEWFEKKRKNYVSNNPDPLLLKQLDEPDIRLQFDFLGFYNNEETLLSGTSADILLSLLEGHLKMEPHDRDMIVMVHEVEYEAGSVKEKLTSSLVVKGTDSVNTAMAKTVGTPLALGAILILEGKINITGLHIPVIPEIYEPILKELEKNGIAFNEEVKVIEEV